MGGKKTKGTKAIEAGLDKEIETLRTMLRSAMDQDSGPLSFDQKLDLLATVGKTSNELARLMKTQKDLAEHKIDPAVTLEIALKELEEEWPELKKFGEQFKPKKDKAQA
jgi:hypothetical protein